MLNARNIFGDTAALAASAAAATAIRGIVALALVRYLGPADYGALAAAVALATLACYMVDLGTGYNVIRAISRTPKEAPAHLGNALLATAIALVALTALLNGVVWSFDYPSGARMLMPLLGVGLLLQSARAPFHGALRAIGRAGRSAISEGSGALILGAMCAAGVLLGQPLGYFGVMHLVTGIGGFAVAAAMTLRLLLPRPRPAALPAFVKAGLPFAASSVFYVIYGQIDTVMLANMRGAAEVGIYSAAYKLVALMNLVPAALSAAILPRAFALGPTARNRLRALFGANARYLAAIAIPVAATIGIFAGPIREILMGEAYAGTELLLRILAIQIVLRFLSYAPADALYALGRERSRVAIQGSAAAVNIVLNLMLIPRIGAAGAAIATVATEVLVLALMTRQASLSLGGLGVAASTLRPIAAAAIPIAWLVSNPPIHLLGIATALLGSGLLYCIGLFALGFFKESERRRIREATVGRLRG
ncbi:MAG: hypothetical protein CME06_06660 [Gemmatimonadetes bacterium]|nr:hypothetical protein [Gemmatimonadota bacterium]